MTPVWSHRPEISHLAIFSAAYILGCGFARALAIVPGTGISIWLPSGLFLATLVFAARQGWPWWVLAGFFAELVGNVLWFHNPLPAAVLIFTGNALQAVVGAWLVIHFCRPARLESLQEVLGLTVFGAGVAPIVSATVASATLAWFGLQSFATAWPLFWLGNAAGVLIVAPLVLVLFQDWHGGAGLSKAHWFEASAMGLIFLAMAALSLSNYLPFACLIIPPLLWASVRFEFRGAAVSLILLALIVVVFTISGGSHIADDPGSQRSKQIMPYLFLAVSAFSALVVAAISRQNQLVLRALQRSERQLKDLVDTLPVRIWSTTPGGEPLYFNKRYQDHFRSVIPNFKPPQESRIENFVDELAHPEDAPGVQRILQTCFETGNAAVMRFRWRERDGSYRWAECRVEPRRDENGAIAEWYGVSIDIDDEMRAQQAVRDREHELAQLVDMLPAYIRRLTPKGEPIFFNKRLTDFIGKSLEEIYPVGAGRLEPAVKNYVHPDEAEGVVTAIRRAIATGEPYSMKYRMHGSDGVYRWIETRTEPLRNEDGTIEQWYSVSIDIDDFVASQEALSERERFVWQVVETLPAMVDCAAPNGEPIYRNQQLREFLGYDLDSLDGKGKSRLAGTLDAGVHPDDLEGVKANYAHSLSTGEPYARRHRLRRFDGEYRWVETRAAPMYNTEGATVQWNVICLDIDGEVRAQENLRLAQERLSRASQAASLAELSASIAHEVNQPLAAIVANSHACYRWLVDTPPNLARAKITAERIIRDANAAADVVSRIRALFTRSTEVRSHVALSIVASEGLGLMVDEAARRRVRISTEIENDLPPVLIDRVQILQVLVNLMRNGIEAMDSTADARVLRLRLHRIGNVIQTEISDRGPGIAFPEKIFEPFFTTKEQGMGMGLAVCRSIVESHHGRLWVEKNEPHGATFIFTLPVEAEDAP